MLLDANPPEDVLFGAIVQDALEQTAKQIKSNGVDVSVADTFPRVHADRMRIVEVLVNLVVNRIIHCRGDAPHPTIEIGYRQEEEGGEVVVEGEGTGAGLAIVRRIIKVHEGRVWVQSEKGNGCTVCFTLPDASLIGVVAQQ